MLCVYVKKNNNNKNNKTKYEWTEKQPMTVITNPNCLSFVECRFQKNRGHLKATRHLPRGSHPSPNRHLAVTLPLQIQAGNYTTELSSPLRRQTDHG